MDLYAIDYLTITKKCNDEKEFEIIREKLGTQKQKETRHLNGYIDYNKAKNYDIAHNNVCGLSIMLRMSGKQLEQYKITLIRDLIKASQPVAPF